MCIYTPLIGQIVACKQHMTIDSPIVQTDQRYCMAPENINFGLK